MKKYWRYTGLVFLLLCGFFQGCAELEDYRTANRRQAITIRDQLSEIEKLKAERVALQTQKQASHQLTRNYKEREMTNKRERERLRAEKQRLARTYEERANEYKREKERLRYEKQQLNKAYEERLRAEEEEKRKLRAELENLAKSIGRGAAVRDTGEGPVIQLPEKILFDSGFAVIKKDGKEALSKIAELVKSKPDASVRIDGHTDSDPIVKSKYLWDSNHHLSTGRALSVFDFLIKTEGVNKGRVHIAGYGPNRPISSNSTKEGKRQNRRVDILILPKSRESELIP